MLDSETLSAGWRLLQGYYRVPERGYLRSALAFSAPRGSSFDLDDVSLEPATVAEPPPGAPPIRLENDSLRLLLTPRATLDRLEDARNDKSYAANERDLPVFTAVRGSIVYPATSLAREGASTKKREAGNPGLPTSTVSRSAFPSSACGQSLAGSTQPTTTPSASHCSARRKTSTTSPANQGHLPSFSALPATGPTGRSERSSSCSPRPGAGSDARSRMPSGRTASPRRVLKAPGSGIQRCFAVPTSS